MTTSITDSLMLNKERVYPSPYFYVISFKLYDLFIIVFIERRSKNENGHDEEK